MLAFAALALATVAAFFLTQHLKATTPLIAGLPAPVPAAFDPLGSHCGSGGQVRRTSFSFYLLHSSDRVDVTVVDSAGRVVRTVASDHPMRRGVRNPDGDFSWDGREDNGRLAPDGLYYVRVRLRRQKRTLTISGSAGPEPVRVESSPPRPQVVGVTPSVVHDTSGRVRIAYRGNEGRGATVLLYRTDLPGRPQLVKSFLTAWAVQRTAWDLRIHGRPAPQGVYLAGLQVTDAACNTGRFPSRLPPAPGSTPGAGITVDILSALPPSSVLAGRPAIVRVQAQGAYRWSLQNGSRRIASGAGRRRGPLRLPALPPGLYALSLASGPTRVAVPVVAAGATGPAPRVLVIVPQASWVAADPFDEDGDGMPDTLPGARRVPVGRPVLGGLPAGFAGSSAIIAALERERLPFAVSSDLALAGSGPYPALRAFRGALLAGEAQWIPSALARALRGYVLAGGRVAWLGAARAPREVELAGGELVAGGRQADILKVVRPGGRAPAGPLVRHLGRGILWETSSDELGIASPLSARLGGLAARAWRLLAVG